jgi:hypothetical protein
VLLLNTSLDLLVKSVFIFLHIDIERFKLKYIFVLIKEEAFAALIAFIFIKESVLKLLEIRKYNQFSSDPRLYGPQFSDPASTCYRCVQKLPAVTNASISLLLNASSSSASLLPSNYTLFDEEQCNKLGENFEFNKKCKYAPDIFFVSVFLYVLTFCLAMILRYFRTSRFFPSIVILVLFAVAG